jgi:hypothetical protein
LIGLSHDYKTLKNQSRDGFENHVINLISSRLGLQFLEFIEISFVELENNDVCKIRIYKSTKPAFLKEEDKQEFYVRTGNNSRPFSMSEAVEYIKGHWG